MIETCRVTGKHLAAAKALLGIGQVELAQAATISALTLRRMEASTEAIGGMKNTVAAVLRALHDEKIEFIVGGVRLKERT